MAPGAGSGKPKRKASKDTQNSHPRAPKKSKTEIGSRFKYETLNQQVSRIDVGSSNLLQSASANTLQASDLDDGEDLLDSEIGRALQRIRLLDTSESFQELQYGLLPLCRSLPLVLHHRATILRLLLQHLPNITTSYPIELVSALIETGPELLLADVVPVLECLIDLAYSSTDADVISKSLNSVGHIFRALGTEISQDSALMAKCWATVAEALGGCPVDGSPREEQSAPAQNQDDHSSDSDEERDAEDVQAHLQPAAVDMAVDQPAEDDYQEEVEAPFDAPEEETETQITEDKPLPLPPRKKHRKSGVAAQLQHLLASAFAYFVRKCASSPQALQAIVQLIQKSLDDVAARSTGDFSLGQSIAWVIVESAKSTSSGFHSRFATLFKAFSNGLVKSHTLVLEKTVVGLVHHLGHHKSGSDAGDTDRELLCNTVFKLVESDRPLFAPLLRVLVGTNKGRIFPPSTRKSWFSLVSSLDEKAIEPSVYADTAAWSLIRAAIPDLAAASSSQGSSGVALIEKLFKLPLDRCLEASLLLRDYWALYDDFVPDRMAGLLLSLAKSGSLNAAVEHAAFLQEHQVWSRLSPAKNHELAAMIRQCLSAVLQDPASSTLPCLAAFRLHRLCKPSAEDIISVVKHLESVTPPSAAQGALLAAALEASVPHQQSATISFTAGSIASIIANYRTFASVLQALATSDVPAPQDTATLFPNLCSENAPLRTSTASLLYAWLQEDDRAACEKILDVEQVALNFSDARERCMKIRRLAPFAKTSTSEVSRILIVQYLTGCLKINFKPLWSEAITGLVTLSAEHGDLVWSIAGEALMAIASAKFTEAPSMMPEETKEKTTLSASQPWDAFFEDRSLSQLQTLMQRPLALTVNRHEGERVNTQTFETQLLSLFKQATGPAQKHSRQLVPLYLHLFYDSQAQDMPAKLLRQRLAQWLEMFSHFSNPKALFQSEKLYQSHLRHLASGDANIQKLALSALLTWKQQTIVPFADRLRDLLESNKFRDVLLDFDLSSQADIIPQTSRSDLIPVIIRIFYGLLTSRHAFPGRRVAILQATRQCTPAEIDLFIDLMVKPFEGSVDINDASARKVLGFLSLAGDVLRFLSDSVPARVEEIGDQVLHMAKATKFSDHRQSKAVQKEALRRVVDINRFAPAVATRDAFVRGVFSHLISHRLDTAESSQLPTALIDLANVWAADADLAGSLQHYDERLLPNLFSILRERSQAHEHAKVCELATNLVATADDDEGVRQEVLLPHIDRLLQSLSSSISGKAQVQQSITDDLCKTQLSLVTKLAPVATDRSTAAILLEAAVGLLRKPHSVVPEKFKQDVIQTVSVLLPRIPEEVLSRTAAEPTIFNLFSAVRQRNSRLRLSEALQSLALLKPQLQRVAPLISDLNSFSIKRSEEPDFDRRLAAFSSLNGDLAGILNPLEWHPLVQNLFFFMHDVNELSIRGSANVALRRFVSSASQSDDSSMRALVSDIFLPGVRKGLRAREEIVRTEYLQVLAAAVSDLPGYASLTEMRCLLVGGDQEASFFTNIHHIQVHRRTRALRRLADETEAGHLSSRVLVDVFLPLLHHFFPSHLGEARDPDLLNETVQCIGRISRHLTWGAWRGLVHQYLRLISTDTPALKTVMRVAIVVCKGFHFDLECEEFAPALKHVNDTLLPLLFKTIDKRDVAEEASRISLAEGAAAIISHLPREKKEVEASGLFMSVAKILRSKEQATRDAARAAVCNMMITLGAWSIQIAIKELLSALQRGPQQHVLAFTLHAMLVRVKEELPEADVDEALPLITKVIDTDLFGTPAKDRESQSFRSNSTYREIKGTKSIDSLQIVASMMSINNISLLLAPMKTIMGHTESVKVMRTVDEALLRMAQGLQSNSRLDSHALLSLCYSLISQNASFLKAAPATTKGPQKRQKAADDTLTTTSEVYAANAHRFVCFGLDILNTSFRRNRFDLHNSETVERLDPLISAAGNTLYSNNDLVLSRAVKAAASLLRCPLASVEKSAPVMMVQILRILQSIGGTESEAAQSSIRALTTILRDCKSVSLNEKQLTELLRLVSPDLEETERQPVLFGLIRAIMSRKLVCPEIYDLMDRIAESMVTNQSPSVRELCRAIFLQFLLDYPQGKGRLQNSLGFLARNISYTYESGRLSTLEIIHAVFSKFDPELLAGSEQTFFVALVLCIANDESSKCREAASALISLLVKRVSSERQNHLFAMVCGWVQQDSNPALCRTSVQLLGVFCESFDPANSRPSAEKALSLLWPVIVSASQSPAAAEEAESDLNEQLEWSRVYQALQATLKVLQYFPKLTNPADDQAWAAVRTLLLHPHAWIRAASARLLGALFASHPTATGTLEGDGPFSLPNLVAAADRMTTQLQSRFLSAALAMQVVKNLFFIGKVMAATTSSIQSFDAEETDEVIHNQDAETSSTISKEEQPLSWLFARTARQARLAHVKRPSPFAAEKHNWSLQPQSIFQWFAAMINYLEPEQVKPLLFIIMTPLFRITEDSSKADDQMVELQTLAHEVNELLQHKIGEEVFLQAHAAVSQSVAQHRQARREKAALQVVNDPAAAAASKLKGSQRNREARKRKSQAYKLSRMANV